jgi:hypothetical protein
MTHTRRTAGSKKHRKAVLRKMKKLNKTIAEHGRRYYDLLSEKWELTDWSFKQAQCVLRRMANVLDKLPGAIKQAHERIIGERKVSSNEKLLSLYEDNIHVIVRGKSGAEVEFGNGMYLVEQENGIIVDWDFFKDQPKRDSKLVIESIQRITAKHGKPLSFAGDRGFSSKENRRYLAKHDIENGICPKSVQELKSRLGEDEFVIHQKRRSQTEGRIGTFKNVYLGKPFRSKGFESRKCLIALSILTHNLWLIASKSREALYAQQNVA